MPTASRPFFTFQDSAAQLFQDLQRDGWIGALHGSEDGQAQRERQRERQAHLHVAGRLGGSRLPRRRALRPPAAALLRVLIQEAADSVGRTPRELRSSSGASISDSSAATCWLRADCAMCSAGGARQAAEVHDLHEMTQLPQVDDHPLGASPSVLPLAAARIAMVRAVRAA
jgi:hypothetical protein